MKLMLIGGGEVGRGHTSYETKEIDEEIVKMSSNPNPTFLFIGLASSFSDSYYDTMKKIYSKLGCTCKYLKKKNILNNPDIVKEKILSADIIYICGGDTIKLISDIKNYKIDILLKEAADNNTILVGNSAGAILLSKGGYSDASILRGESKNYEYLEGLNLININFCPHYKSNLEKDKAMFKYLDTNNIQIFSLENCTALKIEDNSYQIIKSNKTKNAYICTKNQETLINEGIIN